MIEELLARAAEMGADRVEIEYKDGRNLVTAFHGPVGTGIGWLDQSDWDSVYEEMRELRKTKRITLGGRSYRLAFSKYESFGDWVYVIAIRGRSK